MRSAGLLVLVACSGQTAPVPDAPPIDAERGFVDVGTSHMFYVLFPGEPTGPLFVFFNGGPGFPTTLGLLADNTAPRTVALDGSVVANPSSFSQLGPLLYIDQRLTGFSYDDAPLDAADFDMQRDATEFTHVILHVLDAHAELQRSRVVLVGESYGGARAQLILDELFDGTAEEVRGHFDAIAPMTAGDQFIGEALIQPVVLGRFQMEATMRHGMPALDTAPQERALATASTELLGGPLAGIPELAGPMRHGARKPEIGTFDSLELALEAQLGPLTAGDLYYATGPLSTAWASDETLVPQAFVRNLQRVKVLITNSIDDPAVDTTSIVPAFAAMGITAVLDGESIAVQRPAGAVTIGLPTYTAQHMVTQAEPAKFLADVKSWLRDR